MAQISPRAISMVAGIATVTTLLLLLRGGGGGGHGEQLRSTGRTGPQDSSGPAAADTGRTLHHASSDTATHLRGTAPLEHLLMAPWLRDDRQAAEHPSQPQRRYPLLVFLHGAGEVDTSLDCLSSCDGLTGALPQLALLTDRSLAKQPAEDPHRWSVAYPFLRDEFAVLAPLSRGSWASADDAAAALDLISRVVRDFEDKVDPARVIITGVSQGGYGVLQLAQARPEWFAGVAPLCGFGSPDLARTLAVHRVATLFVHGANDRMVPVSATDALVAAFNATVHQRGIPDTVPAHRTAPSSSSAVPLLQYWRFEETADPVGYPGTGHASWRNAYADPKFWRWASEVARPPGTPGPIAP